MNLKNQVPTFHSPSTNPTIRLVYKDLATLFQKPQVVGLIFQQTHRLLHPAYLFEDVRFKGFELFVGNTQSSASEIMPVAVCRFDCGERCLDHVTMG